MSWFNISVEMSREASEGASNYLMEQGSPGVSIEDSAYFSIPCGEDVICDESLRPLGEKNIEGQSSMPGETVSISGYFAVDEERIWEVITGLESYLEDLIQLGIDPGNFAITCKKVEEADWAESWKKHYHSVEVSESLVIVPSWIQHTEKTGQTKVQMDPGMAFGCGTHPTTLMCLMALEKCKIKDSIVYDLGCGSGILSTAAAKLGAAKVIAVDFDPISVKAAEENCRLNQVSSQVQVYQGELPAFIEDNKDLPPGDIILANLTAGLIINNLPYLSALCKEDTAIIFSGIIQEKLENLLKNLLDQGYRVEETITEKGWVTLWVVKV
ncbi:50S ribosomal protein L11 methyltransferase [Candidatus Contubernalis alkaliaceticus]|uniref:50S ribosomal protein L11 methyltransferase n=1 Tax=Candidatus Contubernalis alkaliaceticus TaxID=338645 RepID=UPI001F4BD396|nr:50S ribosomal protein L11 methyltransferase [Candidatus Contubernalis alkalaceticus]UNC93239.1 50S ribosomal protein L11 methyltransferase [Candidatus Contubernalis alkalaceticus]